MLRRLYCALILCLSANAYAALKEHPAQAELIANTSAVKPGDTFYIAVRFTLQPKWHVYWINPGDAGLPTVVNFSGPAGFKIEPLELPTPMEFIQPGKIVGYGYTDSLLVIAKVTAPSELPKGSPIEFTATASWLVCKDVCIPGDAKPSLKLEVSDQVKPANEAAFTDWLARVPVDLHEKATASVKKEKNESVISVTWREAVKNVQVFTAPGNSWQLNDLKQSTTGPTTIIRFTPEQLDKTVPTVEMPIVLAYDDAAGHRRSVRMVQHLEAAK